MAEEYVKHGEVTRDLLKELHDQAQRGAKKANPAIIKEGVMCPADPIWLKGVKAWMPPDIWAKSELAKYDVCLL